jgi:hypothetical protein
MLFVTCLFSPLLLLGYLLAHVQNSFAFIGAAGRTYAVLHLGGGTLLAKAEVGAFQGVVRTAVCRVRSRMSHSYCHSALQYITIGAKKQPRSRIWQCAIGAIKIAKFTTGLVPLTRYLYWLRR